MKKLIILLFFLFLKESIHAQQNSISLSIEPYTIKAFPALHSFVIAEQDGNWLIIGGRTDGLHKRRPFESFDAEYSNFNIYVVEHKTGQIWKQPLKKLPQGIAHQLASSNMQFFQQQNDLFITGGYGYSPKIDEHTTYPFLIIADVKKIIASVKIGNIDTTAFRQIRDERFAVTGGRLNKIGDTFYLVGGQRFEGRYNPVGPDHGPGFEQTYANAARRFKLVNGTPEFLEPLTDTALLHKRDYNLLPKFNNDVNTALTAFSGVFQYNIDMPFMNVVNIDNAGISEQKGFSQYLNQYHSAAFTIWDSFRRENNHFFLGGIAQYYFQKDTLVCDPDVPFVKTISKLVQSADGSMMEYELAAKMPDWLGAASEFVPAESLSTTESGIIKLSTEKPEKILIGYVIGGIKSSKGNVFWNDDISNASPLVFKVYANINANNRERINSQCNDGFQLQAYTYGEDGLLYVFKNGAESNLKIEVLNSRKKVLLSTVWKSEKNYMRFNIKNLGKEEFVVLRAMGNGREIVQKILIR